MSGKHGHHKVMQTCLALVLGVVMTVGSLLAPAGMAFATSTVPNFTVSTSSATNQTVDAYMIFEGEVDANDVISNPAWNSTYKSAVLPFLDNTSTATTGASVTYGNWLFTQGYVTRDITGISYGLLTTAEQAAHDNAEYALGYIVAEINASSGVAIASMPGVIAAASNSFSAKLADAIDGAGLGATSTGTAVSGTPANFSSLFEGFYLFYNSDSAPVWTSVGGSTRTAALKLEEVLTVEKYIYEEDAAVWGKAADEGIGQAAKYRLVATVPSAQPTVSYALTFMDGAATGLTPDLSNVKVYAHTGTGSLDPTNTTTDTDITSSFTSTILTGNILQVECTASSGGTTGLGAIDAANLPTSFWGGTGSVIYVQYEATVNGLAVIGSAGNTNGVHLSYGPSTGLMTTTTDTANLYTWQLDLLKIDSTDGSQLENAVFTIQYSADGGTTWQYVQSTDGSLAVAGTTYTPGNANLEFSTDSSGSISVERIDSGLYKLTEVTAPSGYRMPVVTDTNVDIVAVKDNTPTSSTYGQVTSLTATADNGVTVIPTLASGVVEVTIENDPSAQLPITGLTPSQLGTIIGVTLVAGGAVLLVVHNRRAAQQA